MDIQAEVEALLAVEWASLEACMALVDCLEVVLHKMIQVGLEVHLVEDWVQLTAEHQDCSDLELAMGCQGC